MANIKWNPWKMITIGIAVVVTTALITGLVVANRNGTEKESNKPVATAPSAPVRRAEEPPRSGASPNDVLEKALIGGAIGAGVGAAGGAIAGGGKGAGKGAAIGGIVGATAGTLYGINEGKK